jgi:hypothetical protein
MFRSYSINPNNAVLLHNLHNKSYVDEKQLSLKYKNYKSNNNDYLISMYDKNSIKNSPEEVENHKYMRSLIFNSDNKLVCVGPSKSSSTNTENIVSHIYSIEHFAEGTMINLFYNNNQWEIATKTTIGGNVSFFRKDTKGISFRSMFFECLETCDLSLDTDFDIKFNYSFVIQHPDNKIVNQFEKPNIVLVEMFQIKEDEVIGYYPTSNEEDSSSEIILSDALQKIVNTNNYINSNIILNKHCRYNNVNLNDNHIPMGLILRDNNNNRLRIRNPKFEYIRKMRGNQPKLEFHYLELRKNNQLQQYLTLFPEHMEIMQNYQNKIHNFTRQLYNNYVSCYIKKEKPILQYDKEFRQHMFNIHEYYKNTLRPNKKNIQLNDVIGHINNLEPKVLMYSINFKYRKNENDEKTTEENTTEENTTEENTTEENTTEENTNETQLENE